MPGKTACLALFFLSLAPYLYSYTNLPFRFRKGETMEYNITAFNLKVAEQRTKITGITRLSNREVYVIRTVIKTIPAVSRVYPLHNTIESWVDTETLQPLMIRTRISEKSFRKDITILFDREKKIMRLREKGSEKTLPLEKSVLGLDSLLFYIRTVEAAPGEKITFYVHNQKKVQKIDTRVRYIAKKTYVPALKKKVRVIHYKSLNEKGAELWLTDEEHRIPYRFISIKLPVSRYISKTGFISIINSLKKYKAGE